MSEKMTREQAKRIVAFMKGYKGEVLIAPALEKAGKAARDAAGLKDKKRKTGDKTVNVARAGAGLDEA